MINSDDLIQVATVIVHWELDKESLISLRTMKASDGTYLWEADLEGKQNDNKIVGYPYKIVEEEGIRLILEFSDGTKHKIDIE